MLVCMDPSSPPVKRTLHLLKTPDILLANDSGLLGSYLLANISAPRDHKTRQVFDCCSGIHRACLSFILKKSRSTMIWLFCQSGLLKFAPRILDFPGLFYSTRGAEWRRPGPRFRLFLSHGF